jgi:polar amino acid transport system substrate-binding protein
MQYLIRILLIASLSNPVFASEKSLNICWEKELKPPFLMLNDQHQPTGIAVEWLEQILQAHNITPKHRILPWKRCLVELKRGNVDIVPNASFKESRLQFAYYTQPIYSTHLKLYHLNSAQFKPQNFTEIEQFSAYRVGGVNGFNYAPFDGLLKVNLGTKTRKALLAKLERGRLDFAILQQEVLQAMLINQPEQLAKFVAIDSPITPSQPYHALVIKSANGQSIVNLIDNGIKALQNSGEYQQILDGYLEH